jgi:proline racemase
MLRLNVIDSHTGGEPTRVVLDGQLDLKGATMAERRQDFAARLDHLRSGIVNEPRGHEAIVGAVLTPPVRQGSAAGVVFFNNVGYLGMCGHGTIGVVETLKHLGGIQPGEVTLDTPVGPVRAFLRESGEVTIQNVVSYRYRADVTLEVDGLGPLVGPVVGDVAYGGNWFFIVHHPKFAIDLSRAKELTEICDRIRTALADAAITGDEGAEIDHVELFGEPSTPESQSKNFVLCPGGAYDRSPCGTGTSAKLACLYASGALPADEWYRQESVTGSVFAGKVAPIEGGVLPTIVGRAHVTSEATLLFSDEDPIRWGLAT